MKLLAIAFSMIALLISPRTAHAGGAFHLNMINNKVDDCDDSVDDCGDDSNDGTGAPASDGDGGVCEGPDGGSGGGGNGGGGASGGGSKGGKQSQNPDYAGCHLVAVDETTEYDGDVPMKTPTKGTVPGKKTVALHYVCP